MNAASYMLEEYADSDNVLLIHGDDVFTFREVAEASWKIARYLDDAGINKGDRVALVGDSSFFWVASYLGSLISGTVAVPIPSNIEPEKLKVVLGSSQSRIMFVESKYYEKCGCAEAGIKSVTDKEANGGGEDTFLKILQCNAPIRKQYRDVDAGKDLAVLMYTSGSTGEPRGVMVTHRNIIANTESIIEYLSLCETDRVMSVLPFYYCFGTSLLHTHLKVGGSVVIENSFLFPEKILNRMEETGCIGLAGVPSTFQILLRNSTFKKRALPHLRYFQQAGGKLPDSFIVEIKDAFPDKQLFIMYGQTEATARLSYLPPELLDKKLGSIGKGIPGVKLELLDKLGQPVDGKRVGEIVASGDNITAGYWEDQEETRRVFRQGKLFTGDLAKIDEDGFIYIVDRQKDFIKCAGHRVGSKEIEEVVVRMPGVIEAAIIGVPDDKLGEAICLFVSHAKGDGAAGEIAEYCKKNIKWPFAPKRIVCSKILPKNSSGKVDKAILKKDLLDLLSTN